MDRKNIYDKTTIKVDYIDRNWISKIFKGNIRLSLTFCDNDKISSDIVHIKCYDWFYLKPKIIKSINNFINKIYARYQSSPKQKMLNEISYIQNNWQNQSYDSFEKAFNRYREI